tara:strand:+ start:1762 stop:2004 length:243 start_codon:yes stop_codon:yes gene_type:complete
MENSNLIKKSKQRHQVKSRWYYIFWGTATVAVVSGQIFVGSGFRRMAESFDRIVDTTIEILEPEIELYLQPNIYRRERFY